MKMIPKSFPKLQIFLFILIFCFQSCQKEEPDIIEQEQFIEIYSRLLIINELKVEKNTQDRLLQELYKINNVSAAEIDSTVSYYNAHPREWVSIYNRLREKIQKIKREFQEDAIKKSDSLLSKQKSIISTKSFRKSFKSDSIGAIIPGEPKKNKPEKKSSLKENTKKEE
jgi:hypothetical protein